MAKNTISAILNDDEVTALATALGKGQETFSTADVKIAVEWAEDIALKSSLLDGVLNGRITLQVENGELKFGA